MLYVFLMQIALDQLSSGAEINTIAATLFFFFICELLLSIGGTMLFSLYFNQCRVKIIASVNTEICEHIKYTDYRYFDDPDYYDEYTVSYAQYANKSMEAFERFSGMLSTVITIGTLIGYIMSSTIYAILITFVSVVIKVLIDKVINKIDIKKEEESAPVERRSGYYRGILCSRDAAMDIKSTNIYQILMEHYRRSTQQGIEINLKYGKKTTRWSAVQDFALQGSSLAIRMIVCGMIFAGKVGVGSFVSLLSAANSLAWKIQGISKIYAAFDKFALYGEKIKHFMNQPCAIEQQAADSFTDRFSVTEIPYTSMRDSLKTLADGKPLLLFYRFNSEADFSFDTLKTYTFLKDYLSSSNSLPQYTKGAVYGLEALDALREHYASLHQKNSFDHRYSKGLMEHKRIMQMRINYLYQNLHVSNSHCVACAKEAYELSCVLHNMGIRFKMLGDDHILKEINVIMQRMKSIELSYLPSVKNELERRL